MIMFHNNTAITIILPHNNTDYIDFMTKLTQRLDHSITDLSCKQYVKQLHFTVCVMKTCRCINVLRVSLFPLPEFLPPLPSPLAYSLPQLIKDLSDCLTNPFPSSIYLFFFIQNLHFLINTHTRTHTPSLPLFPREGTGVESSCDSRWSSWLPDRHPPPPPPPPLLHLSSVCSLFVSLWLSGSLPKVVHPLVSLKTGSLMPTNSHLEGGSKVRVVSFLEKKKVHVVKTNDQWKSPVAMWVFAGPAANMWNFVLIINVFF